MPRGIIILIVVLSVMLGALLFMPKFKGSGTAPAPVTTGVPAASPGDPVIPGPAPRPATSSTVIAAAPPTVKTTATPRVLTPTVNTSARPSFVDPGTSRSLPELERGYGATTNRDERLDVIMDVAEFPGAESVRVLARLFEAETDPDLKVDLVDSLLGIEGHKTEKLALLTLAIRQGLPTEVRQSAIDGLIDLEDPRAIALLNSLLNDPDPEIREGAQDAIELLQTPPQDLPKLK